jgi:hypothetical protein
MTISKADMLENKQLVLRLLSEYCSKSPIGEEFEKSQPHFEPILDTTWKALADEYDVKLTSMWHFQLTPGGWIKGLEVAGTLCDEQMKKSLGKLSKALKDRLKRTQGPALVGIDEVVSETGLEHYWVPKVIEWRP